MRSTDEWIGKTDDDPIPARVRLRVFARFGGVCHLSGRRIRPSDQWDVDHVVALINGGPHAEHNLAPVLRDKHREKTAADVKQKARNDRVRKIHLGIKKRRRTIPGRKFDGTPIPPKWVNS